MDRRPDQNPRRTSARPIQKDTSAAKVMAAILFVVLLIVVFGGRILSAGLDEVAAPSDAPGNDRKPGDRGKSAPEDMKIAYPAACLKRVRPVQDLGLLAAEGPEGISIATPLGGPVASLASRGPVGWSPSGKLLATQDGKLWTAAGDALRPPVDQTSAVDEPTGRSIRWAWSPRADCLVAVEPEGLTVRSSGGKVATIVSERVSTFAFSPSGTRLLVVMDTSDRKRGGIWLADLEEREMRVLMPLKESAGSWIFYGWSRSERPILLAPKGLNGPSIARPEVGFLPAGASSTCGSEIVVADNGRVATFGVTGTPKYVAADDRYRYLAVACAPNARFLAAVRVLKGAGPDAARLVLLERDGSFIDLLTRGLYRDRSPTWGPSGTGLVLVRRPIGDEAAQQVWFLPEGGIVRQVGLPVVDSNGVPVFDWSADGVPGHPVER